MVEINRVIKLIIICFTVGFLSAAAVFAQSPEKQLYDSLSTRRTVLIDRQETQQNRLASVRRMFSSDPKNRDEYSAEIVRLEKEIFGLRDTIEQISHRMAEIDEERIIADGTAGPAPAATPKDAREPYLVSTDYIRNSLPPDEYSLLQTVQEQERAVARHLISVKYNYDRLVGLDSLYADIGKGARADSLYKMIDNISRESDALVDSIDTAWRQVFDNKVYLYNYVLDRNNESGILSEMERGMQELLAEAEDIEGEYMYDAVALYPVQKGLILDYEIRMAERAGLARAADSLRAVSRNLDERSYFMAPVSTEERLFIDYADYVVTDKPIYDNTNPIPATEIHKNGTVYRVFVGAFQQPQPVSLFRNVSPMSREVRSDRLNYYYIGGYRTYEEAGDAARRLKEHGFKNPRVVVWVDGVYNANPAAESNTVPGSGKSPASSARAKGYRVEIEGADGSLPAEITGIIRKQAPGKEISRIPAPDGRHLFVVGFFDKAAAAQKVADAVNEAAGETLKARAEPIY